MTFTSGFPPCTRFSLALLALCFVVYASALVTSGRLTSVYDLPAESHKSFLLQCDEFWEHKVGGGVGNNHQVYDRTKSPATIVERLLERCLVSLNDRSRFCEYWWRSRYISLDVHQDIDERLAREQKQEADSFRYPNHGHVLCLQVGEQAACGSTWVFQDKEGQHFQVGDPSRVEKAVVVPPKAGRLLRFKGDLYHSVARPPLAYFEPQCHELFSNSRNAEPEDLRRSVMLFNTWDEAPYVDNCNLEFEFDSDQCDAERLLYDWHEVPVKAIGNLNTPKRRLKVGLLGDSVRRGVCKQTLFWELGAHLGDAEIEQIACATEPLSFFVGHGL
jgi:hypothetical protein